jgi:hypothetical protein
MVISTISPPNYLPLETTIPDRKSGQIHFFLGARIISPYGVCPDSYRDETGNEMKKIFALLYTKKLLAYSFNHRLLISVTAGFLQQKQQISSALINTNVPVHAGSFFVFKE